MPVRVTLLPLVLIICLIGGCASDVSRSETYRHLIGREVCLSEPMVLWRNRCQPGSLAPYEIEVGMGTYSSHERVAELDTNVPLQVESVKRRHYLIGTPDGPDDFLIVGLDDPRGSGKVRAEVGLGKVSLE